jgi:serine O-acetyltransferase
VVVEPVPAEATVIGVPGRITRINGRRFGTQPRDILDHGRLPDPVVETLRCLVDRVELLESQVRDLTKTTPVDWDEEIPLTCGWIGSDGKSEVT